MKKNPEKKKENRIIALALAQKELQQVGGAFENISTCSVGSDSD